ncbi:MAG: CRISPR-associated DxTHG motif protein [Candidatus Bathyarchaeota archaeon]|nr:MAG: CRISPR-associated DxTHG motif protein [Candidatus Bathyarchaeota archaeon]
MLFPKRWIYRHVFPQNSPFLQLVTSINFFPFMAYEAVCFFSIS